MTSSSSRRSGRIGGEVATIRKERRFEDIVSDEEEDDDVMPTFLQKGKESSNGTGSQIDKRSHHSPLRKPRSTLHEQVGEDGFIFSIDGPTTSKASKSKIPGAKGPPPTDQLTVREKIAEAETPIIRRNQRKRAQVDAGPSSTSDEEHFRPNGTEKRQPSDSVRRIRRTSQLKDGTPAYPHPSISDKDLHNYCSGDLEPKERMKHVAGWILERRRKEVKSKLQEEKAGGYRGPLLAALKTTLRDLNKGAVQTHRQQQQKQASSSSSNHGANGLARKRTKLTSHPRNDSNREKKIKLKEVVQSLKREKEAWQKEQEELDKILKETDALAQSEKEEDGEFDHDDVLDIIDEGHQWSAEDKIRLQRVRQALEMGRDRAASGSNKGKEADQILQIGTEADPRWKDVEFNADLLLSKTHTFAQLSTLSQRYIDAVSARGAQALKEMTQGPSRRPNSLQGSGTSSTISRESRDNLDRILSEIRTITDDSHEEGGNQIHGVGDVSEGDILRAYAQMS